MLKEEYLFAGKYKLKRLLGRGGFSEVWLAEDTMTNVEVAVKVYASQARLGEEGIEIFRKEFALVFDLNHTNLLHPTYFDVWENMPYLILPYCKEGSVFKYISTGEQISEEQCWNILHDVAAGLAYMHDRTPPLIHQDIKPDNILISNEGHYMITDFGISTKVRNTMATIQNAATMSSGTLAYMGPERFSTKPKPLMASDVWSLGAMMYELMTGGNPPFGNHGGALQKGGAEIPEIEETQYSEQLKQMVYWCMAVNTWDRPVARAIEEITYKKLHNIDITADLAKAKQEQQQQPEPPKPQQQQQRPARPTTIGASQWQQGGFTPQPRFSGTYDRQPRMSGNYGPQPGGYDPNLSGTQMDRSHAGSVMPYGGKSKTGLYIGIAAAAIVAVCIALFLVLRSGSDDNDVQESETTEANIDTAKLYKLQSDANSQISAGSQTYQLKEKNNELTNEDGGAVESYFINALDIYDQLEGTSGYAQMDNDFKNEVEQNRKTAKEYLTKILKAINDKADQLKKAFGEDDEITKKVNDRIKKIKNRLK